MTKIRRKRVSNKPKQFPSWIPASLGLAGLILIGLAAWSLFSERLAAPASSRATPEVRGAPRLKVDKEVVDLGDVPLGQWVQVSFVLKNTGDQALRLIEAPYIKVLEGC